METLNPYVEYSDKFDRFAAEKFPHQLDISLELGLLDECMDWCRNNLEYEYRINQTSFSLKDCEYHFYFEDSHDAVAFALRWANTK